MKKSIFSIVFLFFCCPFVSAQNFVPHTDFHAGLHSGSWTLQREQILDWESRDKYRSCNDPFCERCSKHLADYGHEYQYIGGPNQRKLWYRGTAGTIAPVTQRGYDQHGRPYTHRGAPTAVMSWEYQRVLNHAIWEQLQAHNAVAVQETIEDRVNALKELQETARKLLANSEERWKRAEPTGHCAGCSHPAGSPCSPVQTEQEIQNTASSFKPCCNAHCEYCKIWRQYQKDLAYTALVERELSCASQNLQYTAAITDEKVRIALLSKEDADKATRFKRIQHKPPKYKEVLAAREAQEAAKQKAAIQTPKLAEEEKKSIEDTTEGEGITELPKIKN